MSVNLYYKKINLYDESERLEYDKSRNRKIVLIKSGRWEGHNATICYSIPTYNKHQQPASGLRIHTYPLRPGGWDGFITLTDDQFEIV